MPEDAFIIGIAGGSCSGKTTLARMVAEALAGRDRAVLSLDSYYRDLTGSSREEKASVNFDHPDAIDHTLAAEHLGRLARSESVRIPVYDFETHSRAPESGWKPCSLDGPGTLRPVVIVEGLFVFHYLAIRYLLDLSVFVKAGVEVCLARRIERDVRERGRTEESVIKRFESMTRPMYDRFVLPTASLADIEVDGERDFKDAVASIVSMIPAASR